MMPIPPADFAAQTAFTLLDVDVECHWYARDFAALALLSERAADREHARGAARWRGGLLALAAGGGGFRGLHTARVRGAAVIVCLGLNPALDITYRIDRMVRGRHSGCARCMPGLGKATNVANVVTQLDGQAHLVARLGGPAGRSARSSPRPPSR